MIGEESLSNPPSVHFSDVQVYQGNLTQLQQEIDHFFLQQASRIINSTQQNDTLSEIINQTQHYLQNFKALLTEFSNQSINFKINLKIWNSVIKKIISNCEISQNYIQVLKKVNQIMIVDLDDIIEIVYDISRINLHKGEMFSHLCECLEIFGVTHKKWVDLMDDIGEAIQKKEKDLTFNLRGITLLNILLQNNEGLKFVEKFDFINHLQQLIYLFIDNQFLCEQIMICSFLIYYQSKESKLIYVLKINHLLSVLIQHFKNDNLVLNTLKIVGSLKYLDKHSFEFFDLEIIRILYEWSQYISNFSKGSNINCKTAKIIIQIFIHLKASQAEKLKNLSDQITTVCFNFINLFSDQQKLMQQCCLLVIDNYIDKQAQAKLLEINNIFVIVKLGVRYLWNISIFHYFMRIINLIALHNVEQLDNLATNTVINNLFQAQIKISYQFNCNQIIIEDILQYIINVCQNEILCFIIWQSEVCQQIFFLITSTKLKENVLVVQLLLNALQIFSQIENFQQFIFKNIKQLILIIQNYLIVYEISDDYIIIIQNLINSQIFSIDQIIEEFLPITLNIIRNQQDNQQLIIKLYDIYDQLSKHDLQTRLKIQDMCQNVIDEQIQDKINPCLNTLNEFVGRQSISYENLLTQEAKFYLINGVNCKLYKEDGSISNLLVFITYDLACIWCKHRGDSITKQKWRLATKHVISIKDYLNDIEGWRQSPFKKFGKKKVDINCCFTITGNVILNKQIQLQHFHICAPSSQDKYKMFEYLKALIQMN